jgi:glyceraldehyde 3-phosphate dehydrogenase
LRIGLVGFGRIGRCLLRLLSSENIVSGGLVVDKFNSVSQAAYLYNFDSNYGPALNRATFTSEPSQSLEIAGEVYTYIDTTNITQDVLEGVLSSVDILVECSGVDSNVVLCRKLIEKGTVKCGIVTWIPNHSIDSIVVFGINHDETEYRGRLVSSHICDGNALSPLLKILDEEFGVIGGSVTTLHPWLSYQNLLDGPVACQSKPGAVYGSYSLGRASSQSLIPKSTTAVSSLSSIIPSINGKLLSHSYRTPTAAVTSADLSLILRERVTTNTVLETLERLSEENPHVTIESEDLVSCDFKGRPESVVIDKRWIAVGEGNLTKVVCWYDNEYGYACRVKDLLAYVIGELE